MNRQMTYVIACLAAMAHFSPVAAEDLASRPNIVLIVADDKNAEVGRHTAVLRIITGFMAEAT